MNSEKFVRKCELVLFLLSIMAPGITRSLAGLDMPRGRSEHHIPKILEENPFSGKFAPASTFSRYRPGLLDNRPDPPDGRYPVRHAGLPRELTVYPIPLRESDHELTFNISWMPPRGPQPRDYSIEVSSVTNTTDCSTPMCYEYNIPGEALSWIVPSYVNSVAETCGVRPGCAYRVRLVAHPWDGHTAANHIVELDECVQGICSCAYSPRLPAPAVAAHTVSIQGDIFVNITWMLPPPSYPQRLPPALQKQYYFVSIGKQMVSDAHPAPWFAYTITRKVNASGPVFTGDSVRWLLLPISERSGEHSGQRSDKRQVVLDVKLLARVSLLDDRGCVGPAGNATAYDPTTSNKTNVGTYVLWAVFGGACVLAMAAILMVSSRAVKRVLNAFRRPGSAPLEPLCRRPAWFPMQLRTLGIRASGPPDRKWSPPPMDICNIRGLADFMYGVYVEQAERKKEYTD